jgi:hypothetical protein
MLKRSGGGHDPKGVNATLQGELGIECPACPHPNRNLPDNWDEESPQQYVPSHDFYDTVNINIDIYILYFLVLMVTSSCD